MMDVSVFVWLQMAAILVCIVVIAAFCLDCRSKGPLVSIRQVDASEEYISSTRFGLIHQYQPSSYLNSINPSSMLSPSLDPGHQRHPSFTPTENESNPSYENPADGPEYQQPESDGEDGYIIVLADQPKDEAPPTNESRPSTPSRVSTPSSEDDHPYVNVEEMKHRENTDKREYLNVELLQNPAAAAAAGKCDSDEDDDEGNYVNINQQQMHDGT
ncbi:hypothetical protein LDENG_00160030 [Lucifuga dentata]|nr:hypothetical protein LDENG_00160030 [Lucifuga dentata]